MSEKEVDQASGVETTGHEWDGIRELNNPLPRWWLWTFYACIAFSLGYVLYYPSIPLIKSAAPSISGMTNRAALQEELKAVEASRADRMSKLDSSDLETIANDAELVRFANAGGHSLFKVHCTQCHGSGAEGSPGYPNLNDDDWIWGGDLATIYGSIKHGIRNGIDDDQRDSSMPAFGADELLEKEEISAITNFVLQLSKSEHDASLAETGLPLYAEHCASCHGATGEGERDFGGPNLADNIALYAKESGKMTAAEISRQISTPSHGVMPQWGDKLSDVSIKQLTIYVHGLGGGEKAKAE